MRGNRGRTQIDGHAAQRPLVKAGPEVQNAGRIAGVIVKQRHGDRPVSLAQHRLQLAQDGRTGLHGVNLPLRAQRFGQALQIARGFVHVRLRDLDIIQAGRRVHLDHPGRGRLAHNLTVQLAFRRNVDHHIVHDPGLAAQAPPLDQSAFVLVSLLDRVPGAQGIRRDGDPVFGELTDPRRDLAFRTDAAPAADRIQIDAQLPRGCQNRRALRKAPAFSGRGKDHQCVVGLFASHVRALLLSVSARTYPALRW